MSQDDVRRSQKPYRYGMILLCFGALINWVGLAENYTEPIRYAGVACIVCGALLICTAMCCWLHSPPRNSVGAAGGPGGEVSGFVSQSGFAFCFGLDACNFSADLRRRLASVAIAFLRVLF